MIMGGSTASITSLPDEFIDRDRSRGESPACKS